MLVRKYVDQNGSAAILATKMSVRVIPEVNLRIPCVQAIKHASEGFHPFFETQGRLHHKFKPWVSVPLLPKKTCPPKFFFKKSLILTKRRYAVHFNGEHTRFRFRSP